LKSSCTQAQLENEAALQDLLDNMSGSESNADSGGISDSDEESDGGKTKKIKDGKRWGIMTDWIEYWISHCSEIYLTLTCLELFRRCSRRYRTELSFEDSFVILW